ncbi:MAG: twin-arginine translocation signal domain-containing protein [Gemmatimonadetes bacterium]|nr:twin-arginine translocation signal domain-containing protein [Gemmatimonadota bacterium]
MPTRRQFLRFAAGAAAAATATGLYAWRVEPNWLEIVERPLPIANLPRALSGRTLAQLSDLHVGPLVDDRYLIRSLERLGRLNPDLVALTGDLITYRSPATFDQLGEVLRALPPGRIGSVAILGNHDYGPRWRNIEVANRVVASLEGAGVTVLRNQMTTIAGLDIVGIDDLWARRVDLSVLARRDSAAPGIVLAHNPDCVDRPDWHGYRGWILAGHTHGGQCKPPFFRPPLLPVANKRYSAGEIALAGERTLYVNRGLGHHLRVRFNCRPEITLFRLTEA